MTDTVTGDFADEANRTADCITEQLRLALAHQATLPSSDANGRAIEQARLQIMAKHGLTEDAVKVLTTAECDYIRSFKTDHGFEPPAEFLNPIHLEYRNLLEELGWQKPIPKQ